MLKKAERLGAGVVVMADSFVENCRMKTRKGQVSTELLVIVGLVLLIFIPMLVLVYFKANEASEQIGTYQAELLVFKIAHTANSVGSLGTGSFMYTDLYIPQNVIYLKTATFGTGGEVALKLNTVEGESEIVEIVKYPLVNPGVLAEGPSYGWARFKIESIYEDGVGKINITRVS